MITETIAVKWPDVEVSDRNKIPEIKVSPSDLFQVAEFLRSNDICSFDFLVSQSGVDRMDSLEVVYHLRSTFTDEMLVIRTITKDRENPVLESVSEIWKTAEFHEREIFDLFGIRFRNHPDLRRIFLDDDWTGYPLRKDYTDTVNIIEK